MKSKIFVGGDAEEFRPCVKNIPIRASEAASLLTYKGCCFQEETQ